ncbi:MAG: addiction module protein [Xanthomonadaceae bacterium]|nr:addiction module protein [Xanthomonadaceae bacterium]
MASCVSSAARWYAPEEIARSWVEEILRRVSEIEAGCAQLVPAEEVSQKSIP